MLKAMILLAHFGQLYCCDERDCKPASQEEIRQSSTGLQVWEPTGWRTIPHSWEHLHPSGDGQIWICRTTDGFIRCIFIPSLS